MAARHPSAAPSLHLDTNGVSPFGGDLDALSDETCVPGVCVSPALAEKKDFPPLHYLPGHFEDPVISPDNRWIALTSRHVYGPEDLLVISGD